jgi:hypothetical protein
MAKLMRPKQGKRGFDTEAAAGIKEGYHTALLLLPPPLISFFCFSLLDFNLSTEQSISHTKQPIITHHSNSNDVFPKHVQHVQYFFIQLRLLRQHRQRRLQRQQLRYQRPGIFLQFPDLHAVVLIISSRATTTALATTVPRRRTPTPTITPTPMAPTTIAIQT